MRDIGKLPYIYRNLPYLQLYDVRQRRVLREFRGHEDTVTSVSLLGWPSANVRETTVRSDYVDGMGISHFHPFRVSRHSLNDDWSLALLTIRLWEYGISMKEVQLIFYQSSYIGFPVRV